MDDQVLARIRGIMKRLPGVEESRDKFGHYAFKVGKQSLALLGEGPSLGIKTDLATQAVLIKRGKFYRTPYVGQHGWVSIDGNAKQMDWKAIEEVITDTYRATAPKKLLKEWGK